MKTILLRQVSAGLIVGAALGAALPQAAVAQSASPPTALPGTTLDDRPGPLSRKLSDTGGVIAPRGNVDPQMHVPAPATGAMPVIKPGTSGGVAK